MKQSKGVKTHLSTDKIERSFQKSAKERKKSKHLYTLNKESEDQNSSQINKNAKDQYVQRSLKRPVKQSYKITRKDISSQNSSSEEQNQSDEHKKFSKQIRNYQSGNSSQKQSQAQMASDNQSVASDEEQRVQALFLPENEDKHQQKLHLTIKNLQQENDLLKASLIAHENRQKQMISRYAKLEAEIKRLQFEKLKINKSQKERKVEENQIKRAKQETEKLRKLNEQILGHIQSQNMRIFSYIKNLICKLSSEGSQIQPATKRQNDSIRVYLQKCLSTLKQNRKSIFKRFQSINESSNKQNVSNNSETQYIKGVNDWSFSYEKERIIELREENVKLVGQVKKIKEQFDKISQAYKKSSGERENQYRNQKKQLCEKYDKAIEDVKGKYKSMMQKIQEQQEKYQIRINELQSQLISKQKIIKKLKDQLNQLNVRLDEFQQERFELLKHSFSKKQPNFHSKKRYIDGDFLNESLNSNKQKSFSNVHKQSFYKYQPQIKRKRKHEQIYDKMMKKSDEVNLQVQSSKKVEQDLHRIDNQIQLLQKEILEEYQDLY